jgi:hypothetical protein
MAFPFSSDSRTGGDHGVGADLLSALPHRAPHFLLTFNQYQTHHLPQV